MSGPMIPATEDTFESRVKELLPFMSDSQRADVADSMYRELERKAAALDTAVKLSPLQRVNAVNQQLMDPYGGRTQPQTVGDYLGQFAATGAAVHEVLEFLAAQANMDIFAKNPKAKTLYEQIIHRGLSAVFQYGNR